jgi:hypothetical protein
MFMLVAGDRSRNIFRAAHVMNTRHNEAVPRMRPPSRTLHPSAVKNSLEIVTLLVKEFETFRHP